jgi:hypothetical protein
MWTWPHALVFASRPIGALTPASAFGINLILEVKGTTRYVILPTWSSLPGAIQRADMCDILHERVVIGYMDRENGHGQ